MCKVCMVEFKINWKKEGQEEFEALGIPGMEAEIDPGMAVLDLYYLSRISEYGENETVVESNGTIYCVALSYQDFKRVYRVATGESIYSAERILEIEKKKNEQEAVKIRARFGL